MGRLEAYVCRCEKVRIEDVKRAVEEGFRDLESLKRRLRIGMGPCQGRYCIPLLISILKRLGVEIDASKQPRIRPPLMPLPAYLLASHNEGCSEDGEV
ncbi:MAG TPA: (2Fe-2S)-binding protein [Thermofilum sp.]|nr:(2Fe-2S)-binding protein [Thermofilum sp.]